MSKIQSIKDGERIIIAIHGWTGNINSLKPLSKQWEFPATKWIHIQGPYKVKPKGFSWFKGNDQDGWEYEKSFDILNHTIQNLVENGYQHKNIFMLGFSQGACLAMEFMIKQGFSIGGIIPISGFIKNKSYFNRAENILSKDTAVLLFHGEKDHIINAKESRIAFELFMGLGYKTDLYIFKGGIRYHLEPKG